MPAADSDAFIADDASPVVVIWIIWDTIIGAGGIDYAAADVDVF